MEYKYAVVIKWCRADNPTYTAVAEVEGGGLAEAMVTHLKTKEAVLAVYVVNKGRHSVDWSAVRGEDGEWKNRYNGSDHTVAELALSVAAAFDVWVNTGGRG